ncbi:hypothetical protein KR009_002740 [Drosophila setifemur]|nr:hypothetical protein KR009_002740 [Drosophila setifemur]
MKACRAFGCLFWALLYCVLYLDLVSGNSPDDELLDFDFAVPKDIASQDEWQLDDLDDQQAAAKAELEQKKLESNMLDFSVDLDEPEPERQVPSFDLRERALRVALAKALANDGLRQKFVEVMPILRVLSHQQRLALSALIAAQMNAKKGHDLKLEQVRMMFGNDKKLLLPIVFDLANLVKSSTRNYINFESNMKSSALFHTPIDRRKDYLTTDETDLDDRVGTISVSSAPKQEEHSESVEEFFDEVQSEVLDPQMINEALQDNLRNETKTKADNNNTKTAESDKESHAQRVRRSAMEFVHKLPRSVPLSVTEQQLLGGVAGRTIKLNTTAFQQSSSSPSEEHPSNQSYVEIEDLAFAGLNGTELPLNADERLDLQRNSQEVAEEPLPSPEELIAGPRYRLGKRPPGQKAVPPIKRKRVQTSASGRGRPKTAASSHKPVISPPHKKCERFTSNMCIRTDDYPLDQIMGSIRRHKNAMSALLAEFYDKPNNNLEFGDEFDDFSLSKKRREDEGSAGGMCQSVVRYARPQKAKSASGEWKYIVNTGQHTQTLRLEKCSNPGESCSYLAQTYRSHCSQVYNYHRLLSWDKVRGLHVDIFKVPTCCSCQVDGYRQQFPPLSSIQAKDYSPLAITNGNNNGYSTINEEDLDYADESEEDELGLGLRYPTFNNRETNELYASSKKVRVKLPGISTSVGPYLSPPDDDAEEDRYGGRYKSPGSSSNSKKYNNQVSRRRPQHSEARLDLDLAPSETHADQEVNLFAGPPEKQRVPLNRKRIYASTHTASTASTSASAAAAAASSSSSAASPIGGAPTRFRFPQTTSLPARTGTAAVGSSYSFSPSSSSSSSSSSISSGFLAPAHAAHAHQAASATAAPSQPALQRSRPRFYAPPPPVAGTGSTTHPSFHPVAADSAATLPTERTTQQWEQSTPPPTAPPAVYPVSSIFSSGGSIGSEASGKRINYNYHPIIDFFEKNRRAEVNSAADESRLVEQRIYPEKHSKGMGQGMETITGVYQHPIPNIIPTTLHERRMGYGAGGAGGSGGSGGSGAVGGGDNAWQPMVVE